MYKYNQGPITCKYKRDLQQLADRTQLIVWTASRYAFQAGLKHKIVKHKHNGQETQDD